MVITGPTDITRHMHIIGTSVVPGGRAAGGNLVTTGIIGRIDIITDRMGIVGRRRRQRHVLTHTSSTNSSATQSWFVADQVTAHADQENSPN